MVVIGNELPFWVVLIIRIVEFWDLSSMVTCNGQLNGTLGRYSLGGPPSL